MDTSADAKLARNAFTLVEILTVIVIIAILMGFLMGAVVRARVSVKNAVIRSEISQIDMALTNCKTEFGDLPPDFTDASAASRFIRKAFPKYRFMPGPGDNPADFVSPPNPFLQMLKDISNAPSHPRRPGYGLTQLDPTANPNVLQRLDSASALLFWLGGLPEAVPQGNAAWTPAGFHTDPTLPFKPGLPRTKPLFEFDVERIRLVEPHPDDPGNPAAARFFRYYPAGVQTPYVYFRARTFINPITSTRDWGYEVAGLGQLRYRHSDGDAANGIPPSWCVPYAARTYPNTPRWRNHDTCQIIAAGLDEQFGSADFTTVRVSQVGTGFTDGDYDNLTNFSKGRLEDEIE